MPLERNWLTIGAVGGTVAALGLLSKPTGQSHVPSLTATPATTNRFGLGLVATAQADVGVVETGSNTGPRVDQMLATYGARAVNWCAAAVGTWIRETAARMGVRSPIPGSASAKETMRQFQNELNPAVSWLPIEILRARPELVQAGMVPVWTRGAPGSWMGHIGVCVSPAANGAFQSVEGNAGTVGDRVVQASRQLGAESLLGMGIFHDRAIFGGMGVGYPNDPAGVPTFTSLQSASLIARADATQSRDVVAQADARLRTAETLRYAAIGLGALTLAYAAVKIAE
jgi:hypothetical protein